MDWGAIPHNFDPPLRLKLQELFLFLKKSEKIEEPEAAVAFLGSNKKHFHKLKNELKDILYAYILTNPSTWVDSEHKALYDQIYKSFAAYKILFNRRKSIKCGGACQIFIFKIYIKIIP